MAQIIVIEDETKIARLIKRSLETQGHQVQCYGNGRQGIQALRQQRADLLLLDINLPDMSGYQVIEQLKEDAQAHLPPVVMISAQSDLVNRLQGLQHAEDFILKPFRIQALRERVDYVLARSQQGMPLSAELTELAQQRVGRYQVLEPLSRSEHAILYCAQHLDSQEHVVLKFVLGTLGDDKRQERFRLEIAVLQTLDHPHIVPVYSAERVGDGAGYTMMVMPFVRGQKLHDALETHPQGLGLADSLKYARQLAAGLAYAHSKAIIHRDVKPDNVMIDHNDMVRILDFGVAKLEKLGSQDLKLTMPGMLLGTMTHMAPELLMNQPYDYRIDIWGFGVVLFQMLTGRHPFASSEKDIVMLLHNISHKAAPIEWLESCPSALQSLVEQLLSKDPHQRPANFEVVIDVLDELQHSL